MGVVLQTDYAWPDDHVERQIIEAAGHVLEAGTPIPATSDEIAERVARVRPDAIMTCWGEVSAEAIGASEHLRIVQRIGVGLDNIAVPAATDQGVWVANVPDYCVDEVSDHAVAMLLDWARGVTALDRQVKNGRWDPAGARLRRVRDLTVGIVGYGRIGRATATRLAAFGCRIVAYDPHPSQGGLIRFTSLEDLLAHSDVIIVHAPLVDDTRHLIDARRLGAVKEGAFLINVSRGPLVENGALIAALESGRLSGAGLDVIDGEPHPPVELTGRADVIATPHVAFSSDASLIELRRRSAEEVVRVLAGEPPRHPCNRPRALA